MTSQRRKTLKTLKTLSGWTSSLLLLGGCSDSDDVWSGASGWLIGLGIAILLVTAILAVRHKGKG